MMMHDPELVNEPLMLVLLLATRDCWIVLVQVADAPSTDTARRWTSFSVTVLPEMVPVIVSSISPGVPVCLPVMLLPT